MQEVVKMTHGCVARKTSATSGAQVNANSVTVIETDSMNVPTYTICLILDICDPACENGGTCTAPDTCECLAGYSGDRCENGMF